MGAEDDHRTEDDPVYTLDDVELEGDGGLDEDEEWLEDIPEDLEISFEGESGHHHHHSGASSGRKSGSGGASSRREGGAARQERQGQKDRSGGRRARKSHSGRSGGEHSRQENHSGRSLQESRADDNDRYGQQDHSGASSGRRSASGGASSRRGDGAGAGQQEAAYVDANGRVHHRAPASNTTRHRHRRLRGWRKGLVIFAVVLVVLILAALITWRALDAVGRSRLYQQGNAVPTLSSVDEEGEEITAEEAAEESGVEWQADWVRYNGTIYDYNENILTFLVMGIDHTSEVEEADNAIEGGQADALFLLIMNPDEKEISILAINRATMVDIDVYSEEDEYLRTELAQICLQHGYGDGLEESCERQVEVVSELLYGLGINGYASINYSAIPVINNAIGGVTLTALEDVPAASVSTSGVASSPYDSRRNLVEGETYTLSGVEAYAYTKWRDTSVEDSASGRLARQKQYLQKFMSAMKDAVMSDVSVVSDLYSAISSYMVTDLDISEVTYLASNISGYTINMDFYELEGETITGEQGSESTFDEFYADEDALYELMLELFYTEVEDA